MASEATLRRKAREVYQFKGPVHAFEWSARDLVQRERLERERDHMLLRREAVAEMKRMKAVDLAALGGEERAVFQVLIFDIEIEGYCPSDLGFLSARARVSKGWVRRSLTVLKDLGIIDEFLDESPYAWLADGPWLPAGAPALQLNRHPFNAPVGAWAW